MSRELKPHLLPIDIRLYPCTALETNDSEESEIPSPRSPERPNHETGLGIRLAHSILGSSRSSLG